MINFVRHNETFVFKLLTLLDFSSNSNIKNYIAIVILIIILVIVILIIIIIIIKKCV